MSRTADREETIRQWQRQWDSTTKAAWTKRLIPDLERWWHQGPRHVSYHMAQALSGHGCFQQYLWARKRANSPSCVHCGYNNDDAEHTIFQCQFWEGNREELVRALGRNPRPEDVIDILCRPRWDDLPSAPGQREKIVAFSSRLATLFHKMVETILQNKEELERTRQRGE